MKPTVAASIAAAALAALPLRAAAGDTYLVAKLGYYGPTKDIAAAGGNFGQLDKSFYWEVGAGTNLSVLGLELTGGYLKSDNALLNLKVTSVPIFLTAKLRIPTPILSPYVEAGAGVYFNKVEIPGTFSESHTTLGGHFGAGLDLRITSLLLGVEARYLLADAGVSGVTLRVDGITVTANLGFYF